MKNYKSAPTYRKKKINRMLLTRILVGLLIVAMVTTVWFFTRSPERVRSIGGGALAMPFGADNFVPFANGAVYTTSKGQIFFIDYSGKTLWGYKNNVTQNKFNVSKDYLAIYSGNKLQLISREGKNVLKRTFEGEITDVRTSSSLIAASILLSDGTEPIVVLTTSGDLLATLPTRSTQTPLNFGLSEGGQDLWVLTMTESSPMEYYIETNRFSPSQKLTGSISMSGSPFYSVFINKHGLIATTPYLLSNYVNSKAVSKENVAGLQLQASLSSQTNVTQVFAPVTAYKSTALVFQNGKRMGKVLFDPAVTQVTLGKQYVYGFLRDKLYVYSYQGKKIATYRLPVFAEKLVNTEDGAHVYIICKNRATMIRLP